MSEYTENLKLFKYNPKEDTDLLFSIERALNRNWDVIDEYIGAFSAGSNVLFDYRYSEYPLYSASWLLSTGTFQSKSLYPTAYDALLIEWDTSKSIGKTHELSNGENYIKRGLSVKLSTDDIYSDYDFIINIENRTFRLPIKVKPSVVCIEETTLDVYGNGMTIGITNGTTNGGLTSVAAQFFHGISAYGNSYGQPASGSGAEAPPFFGNVGLTTDPTKSGIVADISKIKINLPLYFYVGESIQGLLTINAQADIILTELSKRMSTDVVKSYIVENYTSDCSWYRLYSDNLLEQGGYISTNHAEIPFLITFLKPFVKSNYFTQVQYSNGENRYLTVTNKTPTSITVQGESGCSGFNWSVSGYL